MKGKLTQIQHQMHNYPFFMLIFSCVWVSLYLNSPSPSFHYFKVVSNSDSDQTPPSFSAKFIISTVFFIGRLPLPGWVIWFGLLCKYQLHFSGPSWWHNFEVCLMCMFVKYAILALRVFSVEPLTENIKYLHECIYWSICNCWRGWRSLTLITY